MNKKALFQIGQRGVDVVNKPQDLDEAEIILAQNAEVSTSERGAIAQRPGMSRINSSIVGSGSIALFQDIPAALTRDATAYLYAGLDSSATNKWRRSSDGTTWTNDNTPAKCFSPTNAIVASGRNYSKAVTVGKKLYYCDGLTPIGLHQYDGTSDVIIATIPPAVSGTALATPTVVAYPGTYGTTNMYGAPIGSAGGATTITYKVVAIAGASHSAASAAITFGTLYAPSTLDSSNYIELLGNSPYGIGPVAGALSFDVYRTATNGTPSSVGKIGNIPISDGLYTLGNGSGGASPGNFFDKGLVGDASTPPATAAGASAGDVIYVLDMITDGGSIYIAVLDAAGTDPNPYGRILQFNPASLTWSQIGASFATASGNGTAGSLAFYQGALCYSTYIGNTSGNTSYITNTNYPLPIGLEVKTTGASLQVCSMTVFNGDLYVGSMSLVAGNAAIVSKRTEIATWSTVRTAPATAVLNAYTSLTTFNGKLFAGWYSGDGTSGARVESSPDGTTWTNEAGFGTKEIPCQFVTFSGNLYMVTGALGQSSPTSKLWQRTPSGTWTAVDDPSDNFAGCLGILYI